jgi:uncharacterized membrane protein YcaP (DUF421 family)
MFQSVDWAAVFTPTVPIIELIVRGSIIYIALFILIRVPLKRQAGAMSVTDLLVIVLVADATQNAMSGDYKSVPDGIILVSVIVFWCFALDWLGYHVPAIGRFIHPPPLDLVRNGQLLRKNMQSELVSYEELMTQLREQGIEHITDVKYARMEGDGHMSVVKRDGERHGPPKKPTT